MKTIKLTKGQFALVDDEDFEFLNQWKWCLSTKGYAVRRVWIGHGHKDRKGVWIYMHRLVNGTSKEMQTDHINHDKLDNRRHNLRSVTNQQNHFNMPLGKNNKSGHQGVFWFKRDKKWQAQITINSQKIHLGYFINFNDAVLSRERAEQKYHAI